MSGPAPIREHIIDLKTGRLSPVWEKYFTRTLNPTITDYGDSISDNETAIALLQKTSIRRSYFYGRTH